MSDVKFKLLTVLRNGSSSSLEDTDEDNIIRLYEHMKKTPTAVSGIIYAAVFKNNIIHCHAIWNGKD